LAAFTYRRQGHIPNKVLAVAVVMGVGAVLLAATACLLLPWIGERRASATTAKT
jgi:hypothetical protein